MLKIIFEDLVTFVVVRIQSSTSTNCEEGVQERCSLCENTITYAENEWADIKKLSLTALREMCRTHGFQSQHLKESKAQRKQLFLGTLQKHFRDIHGLNI